MNKNNDSFQQNIEVEVVYASSHLFEQQALIKLQFSNRITIKSAIEFSGILQKFEEINLEYNKVGVFGKIVNLSQLINNGDRIEIYRDLPLNPNLIRISKISSKTKG